MNWIADDSHFQCIDCLATRREGRSIVSSELLEPFRRFWSPSVVVGMRISQPLLPTIVFDRVSVTQIWADAVNIYNDRFQAAAFCRVAEFSVVDGEIRDSGDVVR